MYILTLLSNLAFVYLMFFPVVFVHELGHAATARFLGFKVFGVVMGYGRKILEIEAFKIPIRLNLIPLQGLTLALPKTKTLFKTRTWFYIWGGLITHVLSVFLCYKLLGADEFFNAIHPKNLFIHFAPLTAFIYANAFLFLGNAIPQKLSLPTGTAYTDGYQLLALPFRKSKGLDELNLVFEEMKAIKYMQQEKYDDALEIYEMLRTLKPDNFLMSMNVGHIELAKGNLDAARDTFVETLEKLEKEKPEDKSYERFKYILYNNIAWTNVVYSREELLAQADDYSEKALNSSPKFAVFLGTRGAVLVRKGEIQQGIELLKRAFKYQSENAARSAEALFIGIGEAKLDNRKEALSRLEQARNLHSNHSFFPIAEKEIIETLQCDN
jgi:tetratricopeptide (TPR) repeat protein